MRSRRLCVLLASSSVAALLIGGGANPAVAACADTVSGTTPGFTNPTGTTIPCVFFTGATVNGNVVNKGIITPGATTGTGVLVDNASTINGSVINSGTISVGSTAIQDQGLITQGITNSGTITALQGVFIDGNAGHATTFLGGITNSGTITTTGLQGIFINIPSFSGGITNGGKINAVNDGIAFVYAPLPGIATPTFSGGITNGGTITSAVADAIILTGGRANAPTAGVHFANGTLTGGITNAGTLSGHKSGINVGSFNLFTGGIINSASGSITASSGDGIRINATNTTNKINVTTFTGGITNSGTISAAGSGIHVLGGFASLTGAVSNAGIITAAGTVGSGDGINIASALASPIVNSGTITGNKAGIFVNSTVENALLNGGIIHAVSTGMHVEGATLTGGVTNSGTISAGAFGIAERTHLTFSGGITNGGVVAASIGIGLSGVSILGNVVNNGTINASIRGISAGSVSAFQSFLGGITNAGTISATGIGIVVTGGQTFAGPINNSGTITAGAIAISLGGAPNAVTINQSGGDIAGAIQFSSHGDTLNVLGGTIDGNILGQNAGDTINFDYGAGTFTYGSAFHFSAVSFANVVSGTIILDGAGNAAGTTSISGGTLEIGDAAHAGATLTSTVNNIAGTLSGFGTITGPVTISSGATLAPGGGPNSASIGTLNIAGSAAINSGSFYDVEINDTTASKTMISGAPGTVTIAGGGTGGTVVVTPEYTTLGPHGGTTFTIVTATGGRSGMFNPTVVENGNFSGSLTLTYDANDVYLVVGNGFVLLGAPTGATQNEQNVVNAINQFILNGGTPPGNFQNLNGLSNQALLTALNELTGEDSTGAATSTFQLINDLFDLLSDMALGTGGGGGNGVGTGQFAATPDDAFPPELALAYNKMLRKNTGQQAAPASFEQRWTAWGAGFGGAANFSGNAVIGSSNLHASDFGYAGGMDYHAAPDLKFGFALAGGGTNWSLAQNLGTGRSDVFAVAGYGIKHYGPLYFTAMAAFGNSWFTTNRIAAFGDQLRATFQGQSYGVRGEAGYRLAVMPTAGVTPYAAVQSQWFHTPTYSEADLTGGGFGLTFAAQNANDTRTELGARADDLTGLGAMPLILRGRLAWAHDSVNNAALTPVFQALPGAPFTVNGAAIPKNSALASAGAQLFLSPSWSVEAKFDGEFASSAQTYAGTGILRYSW